ncbi:GTP-sensing pleiotropic transcriptional regulator CodY [Enterococcus alishanensis]|uniref:Global transcriptional regulator CodY n=1 Tax=Enterococcus alishanensis TaxID=1303817 RepID=A0ABS6TAX1_9ENTE|nr:GTP-sensing pleiotropic transcriptional regulator CodY [Enterococcus alishanensis]MBV7390058.1 GTP-sensing pleiotropic transcriptional regulator CodY [Enterococcus alishanensis]
MVSLLEKTRQINKLMQQKNAFEPQAEMPYNNMARILGDVLEALTYIIGSDGKLLGYNEKIDINTDRVKSFIVDRQFPEIYVSNMENVEKTEANISVENPLTAFPTERSEYYPNGLTTVIPIFGSGERLGTIVVARTDEAFGDDDLVLAEYGATVVGMEILYQQFLNVEENVRSQTAVQMAINTLSYSELKAVKAIFAALEGDEGRLTASNIADEIGITRSVIVNALRKLESAGIIDSRSLGMKGTYLKVLNPLFKEELARHR